MRGSVSPGITTDRIPCTRCYVFFSDVISYQAGTFDVIGRFTRSNLDAYSRGDNALVSANNIIYPCKPYNSSFFLVYVLFRRRLLKRTDVSVGEVTGSVLRSGVRCKSTINYQTAQPTEPSSKCQTGDIRGRKIPMYFLFSTSTKYFFKNYYNFFYFNFPHLTNSRLTNNLLNINDKCSSRRNVIWHLARIKSNNGDVYIDDRTLWKGLHGFIRLRCAFGVMTKSRSGNAAYGARRRSFNEY